MTKQQFDLYGKDDFEVWKTLFDRQVSNLSDKACVEYLKALEEMSEVLHANKIAKFEQLNDWFSYRTGWQIECVPGLIPVEEFFKLLAQKRFCSSTWLRPKHQLDYLEEPDMFHDIFGHVPLLSNHVFSEFMHAFGELGMSMINDQNRLVALQRLYWYTIEFGLIEQNGLKIYGAGIVSSFGESISSLAADTVKRPYDLYNVMQTEFHTDRVQDFYFVIESFEQLFESIVKLSNKWKTYELA